MPGPPPQVKDCVNTSHPIDVDFMGYATVLVYVYLFTCAVSRAIHLVQFNLAVIFTGIPQICPLKIITTIDALRQCIHKSKDLQKLF